jgi:hypothetical protein
MPAGPMERQVRDCSHLELNEAVGAVVGLVVLSEEFCVFGAVFCSSLTFF